MRHFWMTALVAATLGLYAGEYTLDTTHSSVGFSIKHLGISNVKGYFGKFHGSYVLDEKSNILKALKGEVEVASIDTKEPKRDDHLRSADFFDVAKFPKMTFEMTKYQGKGKRGKVFGNLTIKGVTKPVVFYADIGGSAVDPWGNQKSSLSLTGEINRKDFGLNWNKLLETGGFVVGDKVKIIIELEGNAQ
ncbi:MAG: YceI family protein [Campylobacterales bacterium]